MTDPSRTNKELFEENSSLKQRILELEQAELDRKQTKEALLLSEEKFFKVFQTSPYAITITRPEDGKFVDVNDAFTSITGYTREEAVAGSSIGLNLWVNEDDRQGVVTDLVSGRAVVDREVRFRKKSGEIITCLFSAQKLQLNQG
ncbi:MAG: PAS domain S-box protein, partial [Syntrophus sp. (in: bacteria)]